jgi:hypothetical protein
VAGLFLSHSWQDKTFVQRLAIDLVNRGMPVWFDTWEMDTGDSLQNKIYDGIGESDYLVVVLSPDSVASGWVKKELTAALTHEERLGRTFVLPIRIADCEVPLSIGDRLYADFSSDYLEPLEKLASSLRRLGVNDLNEPPEHALVPLVFEKGVYLDGVQLQSRIESLQPRLGQDFEFKADQFFVAPDDRYTSLRRRLVQRKENVETDPHYSPEFSRTLSQRYNELFEFERRLIEGVRLIVNGYLALSSPRWDAGLACHWFARLNRTETLALLYQSQSPDGDLIEFGKECDAVPLDSPTSAARFFEVSNVDFFDTGPKMEETTGPFAKLENPVLVKLDADSSAARRIRDWVVTPVHSVGGWELYSKYLVPQVVHRKFLHPGLPFSLSFDDWFISAH